jgi:hypothetical protein
MSGFVKFVVIALLSLLTSPGTDQAIIESTYSRQDVPLDLNPSSSFWTESHPVYTEKDSFGKVVPGYRTEVRTRWTKNNLYFLFICPYEQLHLRANPNVHRETNELWNWDVAEVFLGSDFADIERYKEFEVSPQGEWVDLDIDLHNPYHEEGWMWNSGFEVLARIDAQKHVWYGAMRIPFFAIDTRRPASGNTLRVNLFRSGGPPGHPHQIAWQSPMSKTFHVPQRFGLIKLVEKGK